MYSLPLHATEHQLFLICSDKGLLLEMSALKLFKVANLVDNTILPCHTLPLHCTTVSLEKYPLQTVAVWGHLTLKTQTKHYRFSHIPLLEILLAFYFPINCHLVKCLNQSFKKVVRLYIPPKMCYSTLKFYSFQSFQLFVLKVNFLVKNKLLKAFTKNNLNSTNISLLICQ